MLSELLKYNPESGKLFWKESRGRVKAGDEAGYKLNHHSGKTYIMVCINSKPFYSHRIAYEIYYGEPPKEVDHINGNSIDNSISNLRSVDSIENKRNLKLYKGNKSGISGVIKNKGKYLARIGNEHIGTFSCFFDACCARKSAEIARGFHKNHGAKR